MGPWEKPYNYLIQKMKIIEKLTANTETQSRFIHKREMRGLGRVLGEREKLLMDLATLNKALENNPAWKSNPYLEKFRQDITQQQQKLLERSSQVLQEAKTERDLIAVELKNNKITRQVRTGYLNPWITTASGRFINERG